MKLALGGVAALAIVLLALGWWLGYFTDPPEEASLEATVDAVAADSTGTDELVDGSLEGQWMVESAQEATFVGYRINEVLTTIGDFEVVGRTSDVVGTLTIDGQTVVAAEFTVDVATLTTDQDRRDKEMREQSMETDLFPEATFVLTDSIELEGVPGEGEVIDLNVVGDLTMHGVTQLVEIPMDAQVVGGLIVVVGQLDILLSDYGIDAPEAAIVASIEDAGVLEFSLVFAR
ncbi:MAG: polyisoprenoid-binding protein YceI [Acidimicrobiales bacterium]